MSSLPHKVFGYKDRSTQVAFVSTGILVLVGINTLPWLWIAGSSYLRRVVVGTAFLGRVFWRMWRILTKLHYLFHADGSVSIVLPNGKKFDLSHEQIQTISPRSQVARWTGWGIMYQPWSGKLYFTTSTKHLLEIVMHDGRRIILSPKKYLDE